MVIGGGQSGLAAGFYLRRAGLKFVILDDHDAPGGAWRYTWDSLRLFSAAQHSSLPGRMMLPAGEDNPDAAHVVNYLTDYETRYDLPIFRPVHVEYVEYENPGYLVRTTAGCWRAGAVINATGSFAEPYVPHYPGQEAFTGRQIHSAQYRRPEEFAGQRVVVVGGANSGAQIAADLLDTAEVTWCTRGEPNFMPDEIDGRELFRLASQKVRAEREGSYTPPRDGGGFTAVVAVPPVRAARKAGRLNPTPMFTHLVPEGIGWDDGTVQPADAIIWCTGFCPALGHLSGLDIRDDDGYVAVEGTESSRYPGLYFLGYGDWTWAASATIIGVGAPAKATVKSITEGQ